MREVRKIPAALIAAVSLLACESTVVSMVEVDVDVVPESIRIEEGDSAAAAAIVRERGGDELHDVPVTWSVEHPQIATVDAEGVVVGLRRGTTRVSASSGGVSGVASVTVVRTGRGDDDEEDEDCPGALEFLGLCVQ
jgi:hypothetical protein